MSDRKPAVTVDVGPVAIPLLVLFVALKLTGAIDWHWAWVLSPLWMFAAAVLSLIVAAFAVAGAISAVMFAVELIESGLTAVRDIVARRRR